jgi:hypothetical protein
MLLQPQQVSCPQCCSRDAIFDPSYTSSGEVVSQPLRAGLANVELSADGAHRWHSVGRELLGEQLGRLLTQRVSVVPGLRCAMGGNLGTADDHHEQFVRTDQR